MPQLNRDCIREVLKNLVSSSPWIHGGFPANQTLLRPRIRDLCACTLVNSDWCIEAVPLLWQSAFCEFVSKRGKRLLVETCLACVAWHVDKDELARLCSLYAQAHTNGNRVNASRIFKRGNRPPTFDYLAHIRVIHYFDLKEGILQWMRKRNLMRSSWHKKVDNLFGGLLGKLHSHTNNIEVRPAVSAVGEAIRDVIVNACTNIEAIAICRERSENYPWHAWQWKHVPPVSPPTVANLDAITELVWRTDPSSADVLKALARSVRNLEILSVSGTFSESMETYDSPEHFLTDPVAAMVDLHVAELVQAQRNLQDLNLEFGAGWWRTLDAVGSQAHCLRRLRVYGAIFDDKSSLRGVARCTDLSSLMFEKGIGLSSRLMEPVVCTSFPHMERLGFFYTDASPETIERMVANASETLNTIFFDGSASILRTVAESAPCLHSVHLAVNENDAGEFEDMLRVFAPRMRYLSLVTGDFDPKTDWLFDALARHDWPALENLAIECLVKFTPGVLRSFLQRARTPALRHLLLVLWFSPKVREIQTVQHWSSEHRLLELKIGCSRSFKWSKSLVGDGRRSAEAFFYGRID